MSKETFPNEKVSVVRGRLTAPLAALCLALAAGAFATPAAAVPAAKPQVKPVAAAKPAKAPKKKATKKPAAKKPAKVEPPRPSEDVARFAERVVATHDNAGRMFVVVDKLQASVFIYGPDGRLSAATPALVGLAAGDASVPGIGDRELSKIKPEERTTPAGRYLASFRPNGGKKKVLWVDYDTSIALHPVREVTRAASKARRLKLLKTPTPEDNRITFGCINVPDAFFDEIVRPAFKGSVGIVYVLPDTRSMAEVFPTLQPALAAGEPSTAGGR